MHRLSFCEKKALLSWYVRQKYILYEVFLSTKNDIDKKCQIIFSPIDKLEVLIFVAFDYVMTCQLFLHYYKTLPLVDKKDQLFPFVVGIVGIVTVAL